MYHSICVSFPKVIKVSEVRKKSIRARLKQYSLEDFRKVFEEAEASDFLKGSTGDWKANFDWLLKESNMLKVLEGNYRNKETQSSSKTKENSFTRFPQRERTKEDFISIEQRLLQKQYAGQRREHG